MIPAPSPRYAVRLSQPAIVPAMVGADIEFSGKIKSLNPETRTGVIIVGAKSDGKKIPASRHWISVSADC